MTLANNLDDVYRVCDPDEPLNATDDRYVDLSEVRGTKIIAKTIARRISRSAEGQYHQQLLTGHRGCGKSTELLRLKKELEEQKFFVVYLDVEDMLDLVDLNYLDVLLSIAKETEKDLREQGLLLNEQLLENLSDWFADRIVEEENKDEANAGVKTEGEAGVTIPLFAKLMAKFTAEIKASSSRRVTTRKNLEHELAVFIEKLNTLLLDARNKVQSQDCKDIVLIIDGLEKMHYRIMEDGQSSHAQLFVHHAEQLKAPHCHIVYTMPISLAFNANLGNDFDDIQMIPMVKNSAEGISCLRQVIEKRIDLESTFEDVDSIDDLANLSGGVIRDLMRLIRLSTETDEEKITQDDIDYAKQALIREYDRLLRNDEFDQLKWVKENKRVTGDQSYERMLNLRIILEYQNGKRWADLHPAIIHIPWVKEKLDQND